MSKLRIYGVNYGVFKTKIHCSSIFLCCCLTIVSVQLRHWSTVVLMFYVFSQINY
jgi:hypothetical protein